MPRPRNKNRDKSFNLYKEKGGNITLQKIADSLNEKLCNIKAWKRLDKWDDKLGIQGKKKGAPKGNYNSIKTGKYMTHERICTPEALKKLCPEIFGDFLDKTKKESTEQRLYRNIVTLDAQINYKLNKFGANTEIFEEMKTLTTMIESFEKLNLKDLEYQEKSLKIEKMKLDIDKLKEDNKESKEGKNSKVNIVIDIPRGNNEDR